MCGIFGFVGKKKLSIAKVLDGLKSLEYRGYDSWGIAYRKDEVIELIKRTGKIGVSRLSDSMTSQIAIGHTRWATHGDVTEANAHPHRDCTGTIAIIHNGIVTNHEKLKNRYIENGHIFVSETDSEVAAHSIEEYRKTYPFAESVRRMFMTLEGMNAFVVMDISSNQLVAIKNGSPLIVGIGKDGTYVASDPYTLSPYTRLIHTLTDGQMAILSDNRISILDVKTNRRLPFVGTKPPLQSIEETRSEYRSLMEKEMNEQPDMLMRISTDKKSIETISLIQRILDRSKRIVLTGCGSAYFAGLAGAYMFAHLRNTCAIAVNASELTNRIPDIDKHTAIIALSQSGETADTLRAIEWAKKKGATIVGLVNVPHSAIWRICDVALELGAGQEKAVASTKAFTAKLA
jgi:glutamine---fructose-6-phosphate transaminase (isomerizing)